MAKPALTVLLTAEGAEAENIVEMDSALQPKPALTVLLTAEDALHTVAIAIATLPKPATLVLLTVGRVHHTAETRIATETKRVTLVRLIAVYARHLNVAEITNATTVKHATPAPPTVDSARPAAVTKFVVLMKPVPRVLLTVGHVRHIAEIINAMVMKPATYALLIVERV